MSQVKVTLNDKEFSVEKVDFAEKYFDITL